MFKYQMPSAHLVVHVIVTFTQNITFHHSINSFSMGFSSEALALISSSELDKSITCASPADQHVTT